VLENGSDKETGVDCKAMAAEGKAKKGRGVSAKVLLTCRVAGAEAVTWSEMAESDAKALQRGGNYVRQYPGHITNAQRRYPSFSLTTTGCFRHRHHKHIRHRSWV